MSQQYQTPGTPRVIPPSPTPSSSTTSQESYFAPITRSAASKRPSPTTPIIEEPSSDTSDTRARTRSRSPKTAAAAQLRRSNATPTPKPPIPKSSQTQQTSPPTSPSSSNGHLSPTSATPKTTSWSNLSRSPSPLGLIPIHRHFRSFIHRHEIPRKALHISIGFFTLHLYTRSTTPASIHPVLLAALIPITTTEYLRHHFPPLNRIYVRCLGALMREDEVNDRYNGVIWYLLGAWMVLRFLPHDVSIMGVLLLSWCDTAASSIGRAWGQYTPRIRRGKSVAGSAAAAVVGVLTAGLFWGWAVPRWGGAQQEGYMFQGTLGWGSRRIGGWVALGVVGLWSGIVASASEVVDLGGLDDNLTIPVLSGLGLWGFLKVFG